MSLLSNKIGHENAYDTQNETTQSTLLQLHESIQNNALEDTCARLKTAFRFKDDALETQFVREQYRTPCFMRVATVFGVIQILIAPSIFYNPSIWVLPGFFWSTAFKSVLFFVFLCGTGGFLLILFSRLPKTHHWWTAVGVSSTMFIFFGYYIFSFLYFLFFPGDYVKTERGQVEVLSCNETIFASSKRLLDNLAVAAQANRSSCRR